MSKYLWVIGTCVALLLNCGQSNMKLEKGTPIYELAKQVAKSYPALDPDVNKTLIKCKYFTITPGVFFTELQLAMGKRVHELLNFDHQRLPEFMRINIERMAERKLLYQAAKDAGLSVPKAKLDSTLNVIFQHNGGKENFIKRISNDGITLETVEKDVEREMLVRQYYEMREAQLTVNNDEILKAYEDDKTATVRHILLQTQGQNDSLKLLTRKKMEELLARAKRGEDFASLAKQYSEDPGSRDRGGLYENFPRGQMVKPFEEAAFSVPVGSISDIVETPYGYHILQIVERKKETRPFEQVKDELQAQLLRSKRRNLRNTLIEELKEKTEFKSYL